MADAREGGAGMTFIRGCSCPACLFHTYSHGILIYGECGRGRNKDDTKMEIGVFGALLPVTYLSSILSST